MSWFASKSPQNVIVYHQEGRKNLYTMLSPDVLMEILRYSQVYNIGIEITWVVGRGSRYRIQKARSNKKKIKKKQTSAIVQAGSRAGISYGAPEAEVSPWCVPGTCTSPPWLNDMQAQTPEIRPHQAAAAAAGTSKLVRSLNHPRFSLPDHLEHTPE